MFAHFFFPVESFLTTQAAPLEGSNAGSSCSAGGEGSIFGRHLTVVEFML